MREIKSTPFKLSDLPGAENPSQALREGLRHALSPEGQAAALAHLATRDVRYGVDPEDPSLLVCIAKDGTRTRGRMADGKFVAVK